LVGGHCELNCFVLLSLVFFPFGIRQDVFRGPENWSLI
jgi:hypothetical protein